jgi:murein DD-endopeptidase MepM/ murein hydrolase activator NlpD
MKSPPRLRGKSTRRAFAFILAAAPAIMWARPVAARSGSPAFGYPVGRAGQALGDGFLIRHGYATENTWYNPGWWHTGEDWYALEGESAGLPVFACADGEVIFVDSNYPGLVVILRHAADLYSMYGHLGDDVSVQVGQRAARGQRLGSILLRTDGRAPSHLHFEIRTFLTTPDVNGDAPRYGVACGYECPPGPGYWPMDAPEHPSAMGWRNPTHVIARRAFPAAIPAGTKSAVAASAPTTAPVWSDSPGTVGAHQIGETSLSAGARFPLLAIAAGPEASDETSAEGYRLWHQIELPDRSRGWIQAAVAADEETGSDGRPSSVRFVLLPDATATA